MRISFDHKHFGRHNTSRTRHPADIVAAQIQQHEMLGPFFGVRQQFVRQRIVFLPESRRAAGCRQSAGQCDLPAEHPHQYFRAGADDLKLPEIKEKHERGRVCAPKSPVKG